MVDLVDDLDEAQCVTHLAHEHEESEDVEHEERHDEPHREVGDVLRVAGGCHPVEDQEGVDHAEEEQAEDVVDLGVAPLLPHDARRDRGAAEGRAGDHDGDDEAQDRDEPRREGGEQGLGGSDAELGGDRVTERPVEPGDAEPEDDGGDEIRRGDRPRGGVHELAKSTLSGPGLHVTAPATGRPRDGAGSGRSGRAPTVGTASRPTETTRP